MLLKINYKKLFYILLGLVIGFLISQFSNQILLFFSNLTSYIKNVSEIINLLIALFIGIMTIFLSRNQILIAKIGLEQNSPIIILTKELDTPLKLNLSNTGSAEAQIISIFYKTPTSEITKLKDFTNFILNRGDNYDIQIFTSRKEYHSFIILYQNQLTGKYYLIGKNIHFDRGTFPIGIKLDTYHSPISVNLFNQLTLLVTNNAYLDTLPTKLEQSLQNYR